jgi:peroxiredoxin
MKTSQRSLSFAFTLFVLVACAGPTLAELAVGQAAPDFKLKDLDGREVSLSAFKGKTVVLEWINPNCPFSRAHSDKKTMSATAAKHADAVWLGINSTNTTHRDYLAPAEHKKFNTEKGITYPVLLDSSGEVGRAYGAATTPHMFVIDGGGKLAYVGAIDDSSRGTAKVNYVDSALGAIASGKTPEPAATKSYGCSVKY